MAQLAIAEIMLGSAFLDTSVLQWFLRLSQESLAPEMADQMMVQLYKMDLRCLLPKLSVPTLVLHYRNNRAIPFEAGLELAAGIPGARFVPLEGDAHGFFFNDTRPLRRTIAEFLGDPIEEDRRPPADAAKSQSTPEAQGGVFRREVSSGRSPLGVKSSA
jgi:pimeloyl-ACP methyl ester carboxylesterase